MSGLRRLPILVFPALAISFCNRMPAWVFMWALVVCHFCRTEMDDVVEGSHAIAHSAGRSFAYLVAWPGWMRKPFSTQDKTSGQTHRSGVALGGC